MATSWKDLLSTFDTKTSSSRQNTPDVERPLEAGNMPLCSCVILTDINILAKKFMTSKDVVIGAIDAYITAEKERGKKWMLLDASSHPQGNVAFRHTGWESYAAQLSDFFVKNQIIANIHTSVFIIGGDDVIPIPRLLLSAKLFLSD